MFSLTQSGMLQDIENVNSIHESMTAYKPEGAGTHTLESLEEAQNLNRWIAGHFKPYLGDRNLELGAGVGTISNHLIPEFNVDFCENSESNLSQLRVRFPGPGHQFYHDFFGIEGGGFFDAIYSSNVLEHFEDDEQVISKSYELLRPGGFFVAYVPASQLLYSSFDKQIGHYRRYDPRDIQRMLSVVNKSRRCFDLVYQEQFNPVGAFAWMVKMKWMGQTRIQKKDVLFYDKVFPYLGWTHGWAKYTLSQNMLFAFQKVQ